MDHQFPGVNDLDIWFCLQDHTFDIENWALFFGSIEHLILFWDIRNIATFKLVPKCTNY